MRRLVPIVLLSACAASTHYIAGTKIADTPGNWDIIRTVEDYRLAMERRDAPALLAMASKDYWENGGTPTGSDDYGYDGLRELLATRFQRTTQIRYSLRYMRIQRKQNRAYVDVLVDASYTFKTPKGPVRQDMRDQDQLVLRNENGKWKFLSGM